MSADDLFAALAIAAVLVGVAVAVVVMQRGGQRRFERLSLAFDFGSSRKVGLFGMTVEGLCNGYACRYTIQPASQYSPGGASVRCDVFGPGRWSAEAATTGSRLLTKIGFLQELEIGDPELERRFRFSADDESALRSLFGTDAVRVAFRELAATENFTGIRTGSSRWETRWSPRASHLDEDAEILRLRLQATVSLASVCGYAPLPSS